VNVAANLNGRLQLQQHGLTHKHLARPAARDWPAETKGKHVREAMQSG
jgi:hypothetical protein